MDYKMYIISDGYSQFLEGSDIECKANCSCSLIKGKYNIIVDTMTPWDREYILEKLKYFDTSPDEIDYVISTHLHTDHFGNNNLFLKAKHIVGHCFSYKNEFYQDPFQKSDCFCIDEKNLYLISTPGHTSSCISLIVQTKDGIVAVTGDLFERKEDIYNENIWLDATSENPKLQRENRLKIINKADWIVPGHGEMFKVTEEIRSHMNKQYSSV